MKPTKRLCDPEYVIYHDQKIPIKTDFRNGLRALHVANDATISSFEKVYGLIYILFGVIPDSEEMAEFLWKKGKAYLQCGDSDEEQNARTKDMDFDYDMGFIEASFQSDYGIDLQTANMSWWRFIRLISGFTEQSVMSRVRQIRTTDLNEYKDPKTREKIAKAKRDLAFDTEYSDEEKALIEQFNAL